MVRNFIMPMKLLAHCLLSLQLCTGCAGAITWFSFYDFWLDTSMEAPPFSFNFSQAAQFINLPTVDLGLGNGGCHNFSWWQSEFGGSVNVMWDVEKAGIFTPPCAQVDCSKVKMSGLAAGWQAKLDKAMEEVKALEFGTMPSWSTVNITTRAWFLGDELLENGIPIANLSAVARHIKQKWGAPTLIYANICGASYIDANNQPSSPGSTCTGAARCAGGEDMPGGCCLDTMLPAEIDYISFVRAPTQSIGSRPLRCSRAFMLNLLGGLQDFYSGSLVNQQGKPQANASSPFYCPKVEGEAACVSRMLKKFIYPKLHPHQKAFVVRPSFNP